MDVGNSDFRFTKLNKDGYEEKEAKPFRQAATAELHIDSLDRYNTTTPGIPAEVTTQELAKLLGPYVTPQPAFTEINRGNSANNFSISPKNGRNFIYGYFERIALTQMQLFFRVPTVVSTDDWQFGNGLIYFSYFRAASSTTFTFGFTIPTDNYRPEQLAATMQSLLRAWPTLNPTALTVEFTDNNEFVFSTNVTNDRIGLTDYASIPGGSNVLATASFRTAKLFGFGASALFSNVVAGQQSIRGFSPNLLYTDYVDICSKTLCKYKRVKDTNSTDSAIQDVICRVYLTAPNQVTDPATNSIVPTLFSTASSSFLFSPIINVMWTNPNYNKWSVEEALSSIDFQLLDMYGHPLFWTSTYNTEFQCTLTVSES